MPARLLAPEPDSTPPGLERKNLSSDQSLEFAKLIGRLATQFINLPVEELDDGITHALHEIATFADADYIYINQRDGDLLTIREGRYWCSDRVAWHGQLNFDLRNGDDGAILGFFENPSAANIPKVSQLPEDSLPRVFLDWLGVKSIAYVPLMPGNVVDGYLGIATVGEERNWSEHTLRLLDSAGAMFRNAMERQQSDIAMRSAQARFRSLLTSNLVGIWIGDESGRILEANDIVLEKLDYTREELEAGRIRWDASETRIFNFLPPEALDELRRHGQVGPWETEVIDRHGHRFPVLAGLARIEGEHGGILGVAQDLSALKQAERALLERSRLERLVSLLSTRFINMPLEELEGGIEDALGELGRFFGVDRAEIYLFSDDGEELNCGYEWCTPSVSRRKHLLQHIPVSRYTEITGRTRRGETVVISRIDDFAAEPRIDRSLFDNWGIRSFLAIPLQIEGKVAGAVTLICSRKEKIWDESATPLLEICAEMFAHSLERKRFQHVVNKLSSRHELILNAVGDGIYGLDMEGRVTFANRAAARMLGWPQEEILGRVAHDLFHHSKPDGSRYARDRCPIYAVMKDGRMRRAGDEVLWKSNGESFPAEYVSTPIVEKQVPVGAVVLFRDITERLKIKESNRQHRIELEHAQRLSTVGEMAAGLAHEINQPLLAIASYASACARRLKSGGDSDPTVVAGVEKISAQALYAGDVVKRIRGYARKTHSQPVALDVNTLISEALDFVKGEAGKNKVTIKQDLEPSLPSLYIDAIQLEQVLLNLIRNAIEELEQCEGRRVMEISTRKLTDTVVVSVSDNGGGLNGLSRNDLFEPFKSGKRDGLGLGLSISRSIVMSNGGTMWAAANEPQGLRISFRLPIAPKDSPHV